jgi:ABC-type Na+ transport system ATPase subunit NatA
VLGFDPPPAAPSSARSVICPFGRLYDNLSARENLAYTAAGGMNGAESRVRIAVALDWVGLAAVADRRVATIHAACQRLGIAECHEGAFATSSRPGSQRLLDLSPR